MNWIDDQELARRSTLHLENHGSTRLAGDSGQFSLAGAQPKLALHRHPITGAREIAALLRDQSTDPASDLATFADALIFNWLIAGTDAHAKNFSLLIAPGPQIRLTPLYDLASALPYPQRIDLQKAKLAMKIGGCYRLCEIRRSHWESCARVLRMPANDLIARAESMIERMAQAVPQVADLLHREGIDEPVIGRLVDAVATHSLVCRKRLANSQE